MFNRDRLLTHCPHCTATSLVSSYDIHGKKWRDVILNPELHTLKMFVKLYFDSVFSVHLDELVIELCSGSK